MQTATTTIILALALSLGGPSAFAQTGEASALIPTHMRPLGACGQVICFWGNTVTSGPVATGAVSVPAQSAPQDVDVVIISRAPVKARLTDPLGRATGFDFHAGVSVANIPTSLLLDGDSPTIFITDSIQGTYQLVMVGTGTGGAFKLDIAYHSGFPFRRAPILESSQLDTIIQEFSGMLLPGQTLHFTLNVFAFRGVQSLFAAFAANLAISATRQAFRANGTFNLAPGRMVSPLTQPVTIQAGEGFLVTIRAGSFTQMPTGTFTFAGVVQGMKLAVELTPTSGASYAFAIAGDFAIAGVEMVNLPSFNPVELRLGIGSTGGETSLNATFTP